MCVNITHHTMARGCNITDNMTAENSDLLCVMLNTILKMCNICEWVFGRLYNKALAPRLRLLRNIMSDVA